MALAVYLGFWAVSPAAWGLGLGSLEVESSLGTPLQASVPVRLGSVESAAGVKVALGSESDYEMVGKPRPPLLNNLEIRLEDGADPVARITSTRPLDSPLFEVLIRVSSDGNQVLKMYTVTLDPPQVSEPDARTQSPPPSSSAAPKTAGASADRPRIRTEQLPARESEQQGDAPEAGGPAVARTRKEGQGPQLQEGRPAVERPDVEVTEGWAKRDRYGPVRPGDTLTTIVKRLRQDPSISLESALVATWKANPDAFIDDNMNLLKQGAVLEVPSASQIREHQQSEAEETIRRQRKEWQERGQPDSETNPGHERYQLKVSMQDPDGEPSDSSEGAAPDSADEQAETSGGSEKESGSGQSSGNAEAGQANGANSGSEPAEGQAGEGADPSGEDAAASSDDKADATAENAAMVAELRTRVTDLQDKLENQQLDNEATVTALEKRIDGLQSDLEKQEKLVAQKNAAMDRLADQEAGGGSGMPARDRYIVWLLAGVNLLMLLAIIALWMRLRTVQKGMGPGPNPGGGEDDEPAPDPLTQADAQAAAGEIKQARSTLWQALAGDPHNWAAYGRLLDLYEQDEDADQFEEVARRLFDQLGDQQPDWQEAIRNRGRRLMPESSLFAGMVGGSQAAQDHTGGPSFDFEGLDLQGPASDGAEAGGESAEVPGVSGGPTGSEEEADLTFDLGEEGDESSPAQTGTDEVTEGAGEADLEFDLGLDEKGPDPAEPAASGEPAGADAGEELDLSLGGEELGSSSGSGQASPEAGGGEDPDLEFDLGLDGEGPEPVGSDASEAPSGADDEGELDLGLGVEGTGSSPVAEEKAQGDDESEDSDLELDLSLDGEGPAPAGSVPSAEPAGAGDEDELDLSLGDGELVTSPVSGESGPEAGGGEDSDLELDLGLDEEEGAEAAVSEGSEEPAGSDDTQELTLSLGEEESGPPGHQPDDGQTAGQPGDDDAGLDLDFGEQTASGDAAPTDSVSMAADEGDDEDLVLSGGGLAAADGEEGTNAGEADLDLDLGPESAQEGNQGSGDEAALEGIEGLEPGGGNGSSASGASASSANGSSAEGVQTANDLGLDLSGWDGEDEQPAEDLGHGASVAGSMSGEGSAGLGGADDDELEIKLDLARAWIDMGDQDSARGLLEEVGSRGDSHQQGRARQMLSALS